MAAHAYRAAIAKCVRSRLNLWLAQHRFCFSARYSPWEFNWCRRSEATPVEGSFTTADGLTAPSFPFCYLFRQFLLGMVVGILSFRVLYKYFWRHHILELNLFWQTPGKIKLRKYVNLLNKPIDDQEYYKCLIDLIYSIVRTFL